MTSVIGTHMTEISNLDSEETTNFTSSGYSDSCELVVLSDANEPSSSSSDEFKETDIKKGDLDEKFNSLDRNQNLRIRHFILQLYNYLGFIDDLICSLSTMINAPIYAIIDYVFNFFGVSQKKINKRLFKNLLLLLFITIAFVHSARKSSMYQSFETRRLFSEHSIITDYYEGELSLLKNRIFSSDLSLVMFYAPWDRQSQNFAPHFLTTAQYHHDQVTFVAINCWLPKSECKTHFKLHYYPIIILQVKISSTDESYVIPFNGPLTSHHLIRFVSDVIHPFSYISEYSELLDLQLKNQAIVLGYFDLQQHKEEFLAFYLASVNKLQYENLASVTFAVATNPKLVEHLKIFKAPSINLILWNTTVIFPTDVIMNAKNITNFVDFHLKEVNSWLHISGKKSLSLNRIFQEGPFMILFTPYNPSYYTNGPFQLLRSVALEYHNCENVSLQTWLSDHFYLKNILEIRNLNLECQKHLKARLHRRVSNALKEKDYSDEFQYVEESAVNFCRIEESKPSAYFSWENLWSSFMESDPLNLEEHCWMDKTLSSCSNKNVSSRGKTWHKPLKNQEEKTLFTKTGPLEDDKISKLIKWASEDHCKRRVLGSNLSRTEFVTKTEKTKFRITGLSCQTNRTLRFVAIDSHLHADFANHIGLSLKDANAKNPKLTGVVIIDPEREERYILKQKLSRNSLAEFVFNFTYNLLERGKQITNVSRNDSYCKEGNVCIRGLDAENYVQIVSRPKQAFVALHYSHHCGACSAVGSVMLICQRLTSDVSNLTFVRIDVSKNTLPWHFTFDTVPTIVFHPHDDKSQTRVFNPDLPITVRNLMSFIVSELKPAERNSLALKLCGANCRKAAISQGLLMKIKLHHSLSVLSQKVSRYFTLLVNTQTELIKYPDNTLLHSKYNLFLDIKNHLMYKIFLIKGKLSHLNQIDNLFSMVPSNYF